MGTKVAGIKPLASVRNKVVGIFLRIFRKIELHFGIMRKVQVNLYPTKA